MAFEHVDIAHLQLERVNHFLSTLHFLPLLHLLSLVLPCLVLQLLPALRHLTLQPLNHTVLVPQLFLQPFHLLLKLVTRVVKATVAALDLR